MHETVNWGKKYYIDGLMQERCNSFANALELHLSYANPSIYCLEKYELYQTLRMNL